VSCQLDVEDVIEWERALRDGVFSLSLHLLHPADAFNNSEGRGGRADAPLDDGETAKLVAAAEEYALYEGLETPVQ
jgi:hypothetical protein